MSGGDRVSFAISGDAIGGVLSYSRIIVSLSSCVGDVVRRSAFGLIRL
jgi:hypothetical protein